MYAKMGGKGDSSTRTTTSSKRNRKRAAEDDVSERVNEDELATDGSGDAHHSERKRRKKKNDNGGLQSNSASERIGVEDNGGGGSSISASMPSVKKGKKKQDKGKGREVAVQDIPIDPRLSGANDDTTSASAGASSGALTQGQLPYFTPHTYTTAPGDQAPFNLSAAAFASAGQSQVPSFLTDGLADPNFAGLQNNEEFLRAFQDLDVTNLEDVLRAFGQHGQAGGTQQQPIGPVRNREALPAGQVPAPSAYVLGQPLRNPPKLPTSTAVSMPMAGTEENVEHAQMLCTKWLSPTKLAELVKTRGLVYKKGKFSTTEEQQIKHAIEEYQRQHDLTAEQVRDKIFAKGIKDRDNAFWSKITSHVPQRPIIAVYHYVRRSHHPLKKQGKWTAAEDAVLKGAVQELGQSWEKVSAQVGRMASDCRDRWRNYINHAENRVNGPWTKDEEELLTKIVTEMTIEEGNDSNNEVFWTQVAAKMGNIRGRQQCRIKWTDSLSKLVKNSGSRPRWSQLDAYILVHKIASLNVRDDSEIDWKLLNDEDWNLWSAHSLQRRWLSLKYSVKGYDEMSHLEIMEILLIRNSSLPSNSPPPLRSRVKSASHVPADVQRVEDEQAQAQATGFISEPQAGPSHMQFGEPHGHPGVAFAQPGMNFGGVDPSTLLGATSAIQASVPVQAAAASIPKDQVIEDDASDLLGRVMPQPEEHEAGSSSSSSESSEESSESSSEVSSDEESSDSDSDSD